jgi:uncharacterized Zn finger protein
MHQRGMVVMCCPKCHQAANFTETIRPVPAAGRDMVFIHCAYCGVVVAVVEQAAVFALLQKIAAMGVR